jgi:hypothetical protein
LHSTDTKQANDLLRHVAESLATQRGADALDNLFLLEHIARVAREQQQWELAEHTAQLMTDFDPSYFGAQYAVALVDEHNGNVEESRRQMAAARLLWTQADPSLIELSQINSKLSTTAVGTSGSRRSQ